MSAFADYIEELIDRKLESIEVGFLAEIKSFDAQKMRASISPGVKIENEFQSINIPVMEDVPCEFIYAGGFYIRPEYAAGDIVACTVQASPFKPFLDSGKKVNVANRIRFSYSNITIRNGIAPKTIAENKFSENGLLIGKGDIYLQIKPDDEGIYIDGDVEINGDVKIDGELETTGDITVNGISFLQHIHSETGANTGPPQ